MPASNAPKKVVALSSGGGHWVQLLRLRPAFAECEVTYVTTRPGFAADLEPGSAFRVIPDCNRDRRLQTVACALSVLVLLLRIRPDVIISTGALPGFLAVFIAKKLGIRTIWVDSVANAEELSLSGQKAGRHADLWLTQWQHLAQPDGPHHFGSVL